MNKRVIKLIVCIMLISTLMIGLCSAYASAATPVWLLRAKAGIAAAMMAANIVFEPIGALEQQALSNAIDPLGIVQTVQDTAWTDYIDQSVIVVRPDKITIDGQEYSEIWLGSDAANSLRASGFDFQTAYNILANQDVPIQYASGAGYCEDIPLYNITLNGTPFVQSQDVVVGKANTDFLNHFNLTLGRLWDGSHTEFFINGYGNRLAETTYAPDSSTFPMHFALRRNGTDGVLHVNYPSNPDWYYATVGSGAYNTVPFTAESFAFDYVSGDIDADPIPEEDGLLLRVPSSYNDGTPGSVYNYDIHDLVNLYPQVDDTNGHELIFDPSLNPDFDVDLDMGNALGDIITAVILAKLADLLGDHAETIYAPMPGKDDPDPHPGVIDPLPDPDPAPEDPTPGTTIADTDWTKLDEFLRWIQSTIDSIRHLTESLQTMLDSIFDAIQSAIQHIAEIPEAIRELADKILEDIELGPSKLFDKALDILKSLFLPLLLPIRAMMNLWHYVVEWIQSITTPFTWIFGIMSGTSGNMVLPIYALLSGGICISIYKALGR